MNAITLCVIDINRIKHYQTQLLCSVKQYSLCNKPHVSVGDGRHQAS